LGRLVFAAGVLLLASCGDSKSGQPVTQGGYSLTATVGEYEDGSGSEGLSILATLRDSSGKGPSTPWTLSLSDSSGDLGVSGQYDASGDGSYALWLFPQVALSTGKHYTLTLVNGSTTLHADLVPSPNAVVGVPLPTLSADGTTLTWASAQGAAAYRCVVSSGGNVQLQSDVAQTQCDVSALPGSMSYSASVLAMDVNLATIAADHAQSPVLPQLDVSEGRLAFAKGNGSAPSVLLSAAGGGLSWNTSSDGLTVWLSIQNSDGTPPLSSWTVSIIGPGIPSSTPLQLTYPASQSQKLFWSYDTNASLGQYSLVATDGTTQLSTTFQVGYQVDLYRPIPSVNVDSSKATVSWPQVLEAKSYFVSIYDDQTGAFIAGQWVNGFSADFPAQDFSATAEPCDAYVLALDYDMTQPGQPTAVRASENAQSPVWFTAP
jgi:hypothetical protein